MLSPTRSQPHRSLHFISITLMYIYTLTRPSRRRRHSFLGRTIYTALYGRSPSKSFRFATCTTAAQPLSSSKFTFTLAIQTSNLNPKAEVMSKRRATSKHTITDDDDFDDDWEQMVSPLKFVLAFIRIVALRLHSESTQKETYEGNGCCRQRER